MQFVFILIELITTSLVDLRIKLSVCGIESPLWRSKESRMLIMISSEKLQILTTQEWSSLALMIKASKYGVEIWNPFRLCSAILLSYSQSRPSVWAHTFQVDKIKIWRFGRRTTVLRIFNFLDQFGAYASTTTEIYSQQVQMASFVLSQQTIPEELIQMSRKCSINKFWRLHQRSQVWLKMILKNWWLLNKWVRFFFHVDSVPGKK